MAASARHTAYADQYGAALTDARRVLTQVADSAGTRLLEGHGDPWIIRQVTTLTRALLSGRAHLCPHINDAPRLAHAAVWAPGHLTCTTCAPTLRPTDDEDTRCDRCRRHTNPVHPGLVGIGPILLAFGLCPPCARHTGLTTN